VGFLNKQQDEDDELPGSGLHVDLDVRICPDCRTEAMPWQDTCATCGATPVLASQLPARSIALPSHLLEGLDDEVEPTDTRSDDGPSSQDE
jgi:hypothetical protein